MWEATDSGGPGKAVGYLHTLYRAASTGTAEELSMREVQVAAHGQYPRCLVASSRAGRLMRFIIDGRLCAPVSVLFQGIAQKLLVGLEVRMNLGWLDVIPFRPSRANDPDQHDAEGSHETQIHDLVERSQHAESLRA